jgi:hypothetical protein
MKKWLLGAVFGALLSTSAFAQGYVQGNTSLSVSSSSARVAFPIAPSSAPYATIVNDGASEAFFVFGTSSSVATTSSIPLPAGAAIQVYAPGSDTYVAAITSSSTTTLRIIQSSTPVSVQTALLSSGGGGGGGSVTQGTVPWADNITQFGGSNVVTGTGASGSGIPRVTVSNDSVVGLTGTLPAFASTPAFTISGTLPAFAAIPTFSINQTTPGSTNLVSTTPKTGTWAISGCTVGTSSSQCIATSTVVNHVQIQNTSSSASIACTWNGGTAVLNSNGSVQLAPGQPASWGPNTAGVPPGALNCIASAASTPLYVEYN